MIIYAKDGTAQEVTPYDGQPVRERNAAINLLKGIRGVGKSFHYKLYGLYKAWKNPSHRFIWLRRYKPELSLEFREKFMSDLIAAANDNLTDLTTDERRLLLDGEFKVTKGIISRDGVPLGYYKSLAESGGKKSIPYPDVSDIYFDEYLIKKGSPQHYIPDEYTTFLEFFSTVARGRQGVHAYLIGNNMSSTDPYSLALGIKPTRNRFTWIKNPINGTKNILMEMYTDDRFARAMYNTAFGQIVEGTAYGDYAFENKALGDSDEFVKQKSKGAFFRFAIRYNNIWVGFWIDQKNGEMYATRRADLTSRRLYALTRDDHTLNTYLVTQAKRNPFFRELAIFYQDAHLFFEDAQLQSFVISWLNLII